MTALLGQLPSLKSSMLLIDLVRLYAHIILSISRRFESPYDASRALSIEPCPARDTAEYEDMVASREVYMSLVGTFLWLANMTRFELSCIS